MHVNSSRNCNVATPPAHKILHNGVAWRDRNTCKIRCKPQLLKTWDRNCAITGVTKSMDIATKNTISGLRGQTMEPPGTSWYFPDRSRNEALRLPRATFRQYGYRSGIVFLCPGNTTEIAAFSGWGSYAADDGSLKVSFAEDLSCILLLYGMVMETSKYVESSMPTFFNASRADCYFTG